MKEIKVEVSIANIAVSADVEWTVNLKVGVRQTNHPIVLLVYRKSTECSLLFHIPHQNRCFAQQSKKVFYLIDFFGGFTNTLMDS